MANLLGESGCGDDASHLEVYGGWAIARVAVRTVDSVYLYSARKNIQGLGLGHREDQTRTIEIEYPESLLGEADEQRLAQLAHEAFYVKLYEQGLVGSGRGATLLGISRREFLDLLDTYNVSIFDENIDFERELRNLESARRT